jgi:hypothetical protein
MIGERTSHSSLPATNVKRLYKGALATKQSSFDSVAFGLLRFARNDGYGEILRRKREDEYALA